MSYFGGGIWVKTRKVHRCEWCGQQIEIGEHAYNYRGQYDSEWQNWYMHEECHTSYDLSGDDEFSPYDNERPSKERPPHKTFDALGPPNIVGPAHSTVMGEN